MRERYEFRILEEHAALLLLKYEGVKLSAGVVRKLTIFSTDPKFTRIGQLERELNERGENLYFSWDVFRVYSAAEIASADIFNFSPLAYFEPAGEMCDTLYDEAEACPICGAGGTQVGPLFLDLKRIPKKPDIAISIAGEIVVNQRFVDVFNDNGITGVDFYPVQQKKMKDLRPTGWYQFIVKPPYVDIIPPTRFGITPFNEDERGEYRCARGDTMGLNKLSEITVSLSSRGQADVAMSKQFIGRRAGILRPSRSVFVSPKVRNVFIESGLKGAGFEIAHLS